MKRWRQIVGLAGSPKRAAILIGFILTVMGPIGAQFFVDPAQELSRALDGQAKDVAAKIEGLKNAQAQYYAFQQQGALIYALQAVGIAGSERSIIGNLYQLSLLSRSNAMRAMIGEMALAGKIGFQTTVDQYNLLIAAARKDFSFAAYTAIDDFETATMAQANQEMVRLQKSLVDLGAGKSIAEATANQRKLMLIALGLLGSAFLLAANLLSTREGRKSDAPGPQREPLSEDELALGSRTGCIGTGQGACHRKARQSMIARCPSGALLAQSAPSP